MAQVPEGRRVFADLTVEQNLRLGAFTRKDKNEIEETISMVYERFPRLKERQKQVQKQVSGTLSGGEQQMLAMGRALMSHPDIILMDEPSMGLSPIMVGEIFNIIEKVHADGTTVLLVEQNAKKALRLLTEPMFWRPEGLQWKGRLRIFCMMRRFRKPISENKRRAGAPAGGYSFRVQLRGGRGKDEEYRDHHCPSVWLRRTDCRKYAGGETWHPLL